MRTKVFTYIIGIPSRGRNKGKMTVSYRTSSRWNEKPFDRIESIFLWIQERAKKDLLSLQHVNVMCSSSLDFPEEYTTDENVIRMANTIRGVKPKTKRTKRARPL